ncbi:unnamed protein product, partial [Ectocarpus sp. 12 AP-2014]
VFSPVRGEEGIVGSAPPFAAWTCPCREPRRAGTNVISFANFPRDTGEGTVSCHIARAVTLACRQHGPRRDEHNAPITLEHFYHKFFMDASWVEKRLEERRSLALDMRKFCRLHRVPLRCFPCPDEPEFRDME